MKKNRKIFRYFAISANIVFFLWIIFNGIDEGFKGSLVQVVSYTGLLFLLVINTVILLTQKSD